MFGVCFLSVHSSNEGQPWFFLSAPDCPHPNPKTPVLCPAHPGEAYMRGCPSPRQGTTSPSGCTQRSVRRGGSPMGQGRGRYLWREARRAVCWGLLLSPPTYLSPG